MLKAFRTRCTLGGLLLALCALGVPGLIEIVEEQRCHDYEFRLTCRELDTHIAVLDAWYISAEDYHRISNDTPTHASMISTENDSELNQVYVYSSPKHNGVYELTNHSIFENSDNSTYNVNATLISNLTDFTVNDTISFNDTFDSVDMSVDFVNASEGCGVETFARSYASWREGDKRKKPVTKASAMNLRAPLSYSVETKLSGFFKSSPRFSMKGNCCVIGEGDYLGIWNLKVAEVVDKDKKESRAKYATLRDAIRNW
nr:uncharacterized protein LOC117990889 [Maniola hyperantus]